MRDKAKDMDGLQLFMSAHKSNGRPLDMREANFIIEYLSDSNFSPEQAAIRAGYSKNTARVSSYRWVSDSKSNPKPYIKELIDKIWESKMKKAEITNDSIMQELKNVAFSNVADLFPIMTGDGISLEEFKKLPREVTSCIASMEQRSDKNGNPTVKIKFHSKLAALELLSKHVYIKAKDSDKEIDTSEKVIIEMPSFSSNPIEQNVENK